MVGLDPSKLFLVLLLAATGGAAAPAAALDVTMTIEFDADQGDALGTFFEAFDAAGTPVAGAGGVDVHSTFVRENPRSVTLYQRTGEPLVTPVGRPPDRRCIRYNFVARAGRLVDTYCGWELHGGGWRRARGLHPGLRGRPEGHVQPLGSGEIVFLGREIRYNGSVVWSAPADDYDGLYPAYYQLGRFFISRVGRLMVCPWRPGDDPLEPEDCDVLPMHDGGAGEIAFTFGSFRDSVLIGGNRGGLWRWQEDALTLVTRTPNGQWYAMAAHRDGVALGHYPSGRVHYYDGKTLADWGGPPVMPGASEEEREAQSLALYGGELYVGVSPWGELYRRDGATGSWRFVARLFPAPLPSRQTTPYHDRMRARGLTPHGEWGQRVKSLTLSMGALYAATSNRGGHRATSHWRALNTAERAPYGVVHRVRLPRVASGELRWSRRTVLRFLIDGRRLAIFQDGRRVAERHAPGAPPRVARIALGNGAHGAFSGTVGGGETR